MYPGALPIIGHSLTLLKYGRDSWVFIKEAMLLALNSGQDACTFVCGNYCFHVLTNPEDCYTVANTCMEKHDIYKFTKGFLGEGLMTAPGSVWKQHRKLLTPAFNQQVLDGFLETFNKESRNLVISFNEKSRKVPFDPLPLLQHWSLFTVCSTTMGFNGSENDTEIFKEYMSILRKLFDYIMQRLLKFWLHNDLLFKWSNLKRQLDKDLHVVNRLSGKVNILKKGDVKGTLNKRVCMKRLIKVDEAKNISNYESRNFKASIELLIELKMKNVFTTKEVKEEGATIIAAGSDSTSLTVNHILINLGSHPDVQEKVYKELLEIFGGVDRDVVKEDLSRMKYLEAVIKENMRLNPIAPLIIRHIDKDIHLRDYILSAGDDIIIPIYALNRHSMWGPDAEVFRPERWLDPGTLPKTSYAFASFGLGRRNCIGSNYAMMTMKTALAHILRRYKITADENGVKYQLHITLMPVSGNEIVIEKRHDV
ncbi:hypothetical protein K1T71_013604 [Dendrolimus kikuchii]|uniref:Uncharacterized protein n=1 Tax=Dendrolimus kikuchii TaxID=765133 RepID=A0ACC1CHB6_9NEOP|nr:hypothetical protein K1T71_013604 [Dendrolimus kikuchii]